MLVGINHPWERCGWDFGVPPLAYDATGSERARWRRDIDVRLATHAASGLSLLRWFVLADGTGYGTDAHAPRRRGRRWEFAPVALSEAFLDDFEALLVACETAGLRLLPSLVGIGFFREPIERAPSAVVKGGRAAVTRSADARARFFDAALEPLLQVSARHRGALYAWEIVNEPEWVTQPCSWWRRRGATVLATDMLAFIADGAQRVRAHGFDRTVGYAHVGSVDAWQARAERHLGRSLDLNITQFHHYPTARQTLPRAPAGRAIVGEIATRFDGLAPWPELGARDSLGARLELARALGYEAALLWSGLAPRADRASNFDDEQRAELARTIASWRPAARGVPTQSGVV